MLLSTKRFAWKSQFWMSVGVAGFPPAPWRTLERLSMARVQRMSVGVARFRPTPSRTLECLSVERVRRMSIGGCRVMPAPVFLECLRSPRRFIRLCREGSVRPSRLTIPILREARTSAGEVDSQEPADGVPGRRSRSGSRPLGWLERPRPCRWRPRTGQARRCSRVAPRSWEAAP